MHVHLVLLMVVTSVRTFVVYMSASVELPIMIRLRIGAVDDELEESNGKNKEPSERADLLEGHGPLQLRQAAMASSPGPVRCRCVQTGLTSRARIRSRSNIQRLSVYPQLQARASSSAVCTHVLTRRSRYPHHQRQRRRQQSHSSSHPRTSSRT